MNYLPSMFSKKSRWCIARPLRTFKFCRYLFPDIDKEDMLRYFETEERQKSVSPTGYIQSEIVMVAKTGRLLLHLLSNIILQSLSVWAIDKN